MKRMHVHVSVDRYRQSDRLLFGAVRGQARRRQVRLRQMDARRSARQFRDLDARPRSPASIISASRSRDDDELQEVYARLRKAGGAVIEQGKTTCCYANRRSPGSTIRPASRGRRSSPPARAPTTATASSRARGSRTHKACCAPQAVAEAGRVGLLRGATSWRPPVTTSLFLCTGNSARSIIAEAILNKIGAGNFRAFSAPAASRRAQVNPHTLTLLRELGYDTSRLPLEVLERVRQARRARARFRVHGLRQRRGRSLPGLAGPADDRALGRARSGRSHRHAPPRSRSPSRMPTACCTSASRSSPRCRSAASTSSACKRRLQRDRPHGRRDREGHRADADAAARATRCSPKRSAPRSCSPTVVGSGIMAQRLAGGNVALALLVQHACRPARSSSC